MQYPLRPEQGVAVDEALRCLRKERQPTLFSSPTGSGKGLCEAALLELAPGAVVTTPNQQIACGILEKLTGDGGVWDLSDAGQQRACERARIYTDLRAKNLAAEGRLTCDGLIRDEAHHGINDTHESLADLLGHPPHVGFTATPYRGTPAGTDELHKLYPGGVFVVATIKACVEKGYISLPEFTTLPLLDDETIDVKDGEFVVKSVESAIRSRTGQLIEVLNGRFDRDASRWVRPATVVLGSVGAVDLVRAALDVAGLPSVTVVAGTTNRADVFRTVLDRRAVLLQVRAVGEGVDLPLRLMYDLSPTMSPVLWMQRVGRIMRPCDDAFCSACGAQAVGRWNEDAPRKEVSTCHHCGAVAVRPTPPVYHSCCHNLMRHGYLFEGLVPRSAVNQARAAWGPDWKPSRRSMTRALGNTGFGRFLPAEVPLRDGGAAWLYALRTADGLRSYAALLIPHAAKPIYFAREDALTGKEVTREVRPGTTVTYNEKRQGKWTVVPSLPDLAGCASYPNDTVFPSMLADWKGYAAGYGLDSSVDPTRKQFTLFRILKDTRKRVT